MLNCSVKYLYIYIFDPEKNDFLVITLSIPTEYSSCNVHVYLPFIILLRLTVAKIVIFQAASHHGNFSLFFFQNILRLNLNFSLLCSHEEKK